MPALLVREKKSITGNFVFQTTLFSSCLPVDYIRDAKYLLSLILGNLLNCIFSTLFPISQQWGQQRYILFFSSVFLLEGWASDQGNQEHRIHGGLNSQPEALFYDSGQMCIFHVKCSNVPLYLR